MRYYLPTINERKSVIEVIDKGDSILKITLKLQRSPSTILKELNPYNSHYSPSKSYKSYLERRRNYNKPRSLGQNTSLCEKLLL